jgi:hypothetical protein
MIMPIAMAGSMIKANVSKLYSPAIASKATTLGISMSSKILRFLPERATTVKAKPIHPKPITVGITISENERYPITQRTKNVSTSTSYLHSLLFLFSPR